MERIYLSRRNLQTLLNKLNRRANGGATHCAIMKNDNKHPKYAQTMDSIMVVAVEDDEYYSERSPGAVVSEDEPR
mgnify:CR=1 FL=1